MFLDEFGFSFREPLARTWAPRGHRPVVKRTERDRRGVSTGVALTLSGRIYQRHFFGGMRSEHVIALLQHLQRHVPGPVLLLWDRARIHTSHATQAYVAAHPELQVESFPAYAPELNPEEYCHGNVKAHLKNATPATAQEVCRLLDRGFARLRRRPDLLAQFVHHAELL